MTFIKYLFIMTILKCNYNWSKRENCPTVAWKKTMTGTNLMKISKITNHFSDAETFYTRIHIQIHILHILCHILLIMDFWLYWCCSQKRFLWSIAYFIELFAILLNLSPLVIPARPFTKVLPLLPQFYIRTHTTFCDAIFYILCRTILTVKQVPYFLE